jgi:hypothetical protein
MRGFATLLAYVAGLSAVLSIGIIGLMALKPLNKPSPVPVVTASQKEQVKQTTITQKDAQPSKKHKVTRAARKREEIPSSGLNAYGYAEQPRRFNQYPSFFFGR